MSSKAEWTPVNRWGIALYDFEGKGDREATLHVHDKVKVFEQEPRGWMQGINTVNGQKGIFPASYIELQEELPATSPTPSRVQPPPPTKPRKAVPPLFSGAQPGDGPQQPAAEGDGGAAGAAAAAAAGGDRPSGEESRGSEASVNSGNRSSVALDIATPRTARAAKGMGENIQKEIDLCMKEWVDELKKCLQAKKLREFNMVKDRMAQLVDWRQQYLDEKLPESVRDEWRRKIIRYMEGGRRLMGLDMIPRTAQGEPADETNSGLVELLELHKGSQELLQVEEVVGRDHSRSVADGNRMSIVGLPDRTAQLYLEVKTLIVMADEPTVFYFSLYHHTGDKLKKVTEDYITYLNEKRAPCASLSNLASDVNLVDKNKVVFSDVPAHMFGALYLVVRMYRYGKVDAEGKRDQEKCLRPYGVSVLDLANSLDSMQDEREFEPENMTIFVPREKEEGSFNTMHEQLINGTGQFPPARLALGVALMLRLFQGDLATLQQDREVLRGVCCAPMLQLGDIRPGESRHDLYVVVKRGEFQQGSKKSPKNITVRASVVDNATGAEVPNALSPGTCAVEQLVSHIHTPVEYHNNSPSIDNMFVVRLPKEMMGRAHIRFDVAHVSSNKGSDFFSFAYLPLVDDAGTALKNEERELPCFKPLSKNDSPAAYLSPSDQFLKANKKKEVLVVESLLCSTQATQNPYLNDLLQWELNRGRLPEVFNKFTFVEADEMLKFVGPILDALFAIAHELRDTQGIGLSVFKILVAFLSTVGDDTSKQREPYARLFKPLLKHYIATKVAAVNDKGFQEFADMHHMLVDSLNQIVAVTESKDMRDSLRCLRYLLQLMSASRQAYSTTRQLAEDENAQFKRSTGKVLSAINELMGETKQTWVATQSITIKSYDKVLLDLSALYTKQELGGVAKEFLESIKTETQVVQRHLLHLIKALVDPESGGLILDPAVRPQVQPTIQRILITNLASDEKEARVVCVDIVRSILHSYEQLEYDIATHPVWELLRFSNMDDCLLGRLLAFLETPLEEDVQAKCSVCILSLLHQALPTALDGQQCADLLASHVLKDVSAAEQQNFDSLLLRLSNRLLSQPPFKDSWIVMFMTTLRTVFKVLNVLTHTVFRSPIPDDRADDLQAMLAMLLDTATLPALALETFSQFKRQFVTDRYGDLRDKLGQLFTLVWAATPVPVRCKAIPRVFRGVVGLCQSGSEQLNEVSRVVYTDMLRAEYEARGSVEEMEGLTVENANRFVKGDGSGFRALLEYVKERINADNNENLKKQVLQLVGSILELETYITSLQQHEDTPENELERSTAVLKLLQYLANNPRHNFLRMDMVMLLARDIHEKVGNCVEAGLALTACADALGWSDQRVEAYQGRGKNFPEQCEWERKEKLLLDAMDMLERGTDFERCVEQSRVLGAFYERTFRFDKLEPLLQREGVLFGRIVRTERFFAEYFRVKFSGQTFGDNNGREFIYKGAVHEVLRNFMDRMVRKYPQATIRLDGDGTPTDKEEIFVTTVWPARTNEKGEELPEEAGVPDKVRKYKLHNNVKRFMYSNAKRASKEKTDNEFKDMWTYKFFFETDVSFPCQIRCAEVVRTFMVKVTPVESAVDNLKDSYRNLAKSIEQNAPKPDRCGDSADLSRYLGGMIDAAVNGGPRKYADAFLVPEYLQSNPQDAHVVAELKKRLVAMSELIPKGLEVHGRICNESMLPLQEHLEKTYKEQWLQKLVLPIKAEMEAAGASS